MLLVAAAPALAVGVSDLPANQWVDYPIKLLDSTPDAFLSSRAWNRLVVDETTGNFYIWEGWVQGHLEADSPFPYAQRPYQIYSDLFVRFRVPDSIDVDGKLGYEFVGVSCWKGDAATGFTLRDPATDHPKMKTPSPTDRHPYGTMVHDTKRNVLWQWNGVNNGVMPLDTWYFDIATETWAQKTPTHNPNPLIPAHAVYLPDQDRVLVLGPNLGDWLEMWSYDITNNDWTQSAAFAAFNLAGYQQALVYDPSRKRVHSFIPYDQDGDGTAELRRFTYDPSNDTFQISAPVGNPQGYSPEIVYDAQRDRMVSLVTPTGESNAQLWAYDFGSNAFTQLAVGGSAPPKLVSNAWQFARDETNDLFIVVRAASDLFVLKGGTISQASPDAGNSSAPDAGRPVDPLSDGGNSSPGLQAVAGGCGCSAGGPNTLPFLIPLWVAFRMGKARRSGEALSPAARSPRSREESAPSRVSRR